MYRRSKYIHMMVCLSRFCAKQKLNRTEMTLSRSRWRWSRWLRGSCGISTHRSENIAGYAETRFNRRTFLQSVNWRCWKRHSRSRDRRFGWTHGSRSWCALEPYWISMKILSSSYIRQSRDPIPNSQSLKRSSSLGKV